MRSVLVEGFAADAIALARYLATTDNARVRLAGPGPGPDAEDARALAALGIRVEPGIDLDRDSDVPDVAFLDVWTPEVAPRVARLRAAGARVSCLSDLVLERSAIPTIGVTGTAGKSTTTAFLVQLLRRTGVSVVASGAGYAGQWWATGALLDALGSPAAPADPPRRVAVLELTSSHLAFCSASPTVAVVTSFWPDHLELHGSLEAYRSAKARIVAAQAPGDRVVVGVDDPACARFAELTPAERWGFSVLADVERGSFFRRGTIVGRDACGKVELGPDPGELGGRRAALLAAVASALAAGVPARALAGKLGGLASPPFRARDAGRRGSTLLVDDGMAATPTKAALGLPPFPAASLVLVAGGATEVAGRSLHATEVERALLERALDEVARAARVVVGFGAAAEVLHARLTERGVTTLTEPDVDSAVGRALELVDDLERSGSPPVALVVAPMFALTLAERERVAAVLDAAKA